MILLCVTNFLQNQHHVAMLLMIYAFWIFLAAFFGDICFHCFKKSQFVFHAWYHMRGFSYVFHAKNMLNQENHLENSSKIWHILCGPGQKTMKWCMVKTTISLKLAANLTTNQRSLLTYRVIFFYQVTIWTLVHNQTNQRNR